MAAKNALCKFVRKNPVVHGFVTHYVQRHPCSQMDRFDPQKRIEVLTLNNNESDTEKQDEEG